MGETQIGVLGPLWKALAIVSAHIHKKTIINTINTNTVNLVQGPVNGVSVKKMACLHRGVSHNVLGTFQHSHV